MLSNKALSASSGVSREPWDINTITYNGTINYGNVGWQASAAPTGMYITSDGTRFFVLSNTNDAVYQFSMNVAWNLTSAVYSGVGVGIGSQEATPTGLSFSSNGTSMYIVGTNRNVFQYSLSNAWVVNTASYSTGRFSVASQDTAPTAITFKDDGTKMYIVGDANNTVFQYSLSTAWQVNTATYDNVSFSVVSQDTSPTGISFSSNGTQMTIAGAASGNVFQYSLSTAWQINTASFTNKQFNGKTGNDAIAGATGVLNDVFMQPDGSSFFNLYAGLGPTTGLSSTLFKYNLSSSYDVNTASIVVITGGYFNLALDNGMVSLYVREDGLKMYALGGISDTVYQYSLNTAWDLATAFYDNVSFFVNTYESVPRGVFFKTDGTKMYITGQNSDNVDEYSLSTAWQVNTATYTASSAVAAVPDPQDLAFKTDGTKLYILGSNGNVAEYSVTTAWSISSITLTTEKFLTTGGDFFFEESGKNVYITGSGIIYKYSMSTPWSISTANLTSTKNIQANTQDTDGISIRNNGSKMIILTGRYRRLLEYRFI